MGAIKHLARAVVPRGVRNWLRSPRKSLTWAWGQTRYLLGGRQVVELRPGWRLVCHPLAYRHSYFAQNEDPAQAEEFDSFLGNCRPGMIFFDVGAHFGLFALAALHYGGRDARAVAVDASPTAAHMIAAQARLNGVEGRLQIVRACVCEEEGVRGMVAVGVTADGYFTSPDRDHTGREVTLTPATTLDALAERIGLRPTHVKIDVEGFEAAVLRGGRALLGSAGAPLLFLELHNELMRQRGEDPSAVLDLLGDLGYRTFAPAGAPAGRDALLARPLVRLVARPVDGER
jgi:FkbM family methyltransferase